MLKAKLTLSALEAREVPATFGVKTAVAVPAPPLTAAEIATPAPPLVGSAIPSERVATPAPPLIQIEPNSRPVAGIALPAGPIARQIQSAPVLQAAGPKKDGVLLVVATPTYQEPGAKKEPGPTATPVYGAAVFQAPGDKPGGNGTSTPTAAPGTGTVTYQAPKTKDDGKDKPPTTTHEAEKKAEPKPAKEPGTDGGSKDKSGSQPAGEGVSNTKPRPVALGTWTGPVGPRSNPMVSQPPTGQTGGTPAGLPDYGVPFADAQLAALDGIWVGTGTGGPNQGCPTDPAVRGTGIVPESSWSVTDLIARVVNPAVQPR